MYELFLSQNFQKKYKEIKKYNPALTKKIKKMLLTLSHDPHYPSLHRHKVDSKEFPDVWSSSVTGDVRIIWTYAKKILIINVIDIGTHSGGKRIYT